MAALDRSRLIALLGQLGDPSDEVAVSAAREADAMVREAGEAWEDLIPGEPSAAAPEDTELAAVLDAPADPAEDARLIDALLARSGISAETREELVGFKRDLAAGELSEMDRRYIRALAKRLGA